MLFIFTVIFFVGAFVGIVLFLILMNLKNTIKDVKEIFGELNVYGKTIFVLYLSVLSFILILMYWLYLNEKDSLSNIIIAASTLGLFLLALITLVYSVIKDSNGKLKKEK